jgi:uncharacterized membrane protein
VTTENRAVTTENRAMLVAAACDPDETRSTSLSKIRVLKMVGRRSLPSLIEATIIPTVLFYGFFVTVGAAAAMLAALVWSYGSVLRRVISGQRIPGVLQLAVAGLTVRTVVGLAGGTFLYFLQPVATTLALALVFLTSLWFGRPMIARLASDFCPIHVDIADRPGVVRLFSGLTLMWAGVHLLSAGVTFALLMSLATPTFVAIKGFISLAITFTAVTFTIAWALRTARAENLVLAPLT